MTKIYKLFCSHCNVEFDGSYSQYKHFKYENRKTYCSSICRFAAAPKPPINGKRRLLIEAICEQCNKPFASKTAKFFCSLKCYTQSKRFRNHYLKIAANGSAVSAERSRAKGREIRHCLHCGDGFEVIKSGRKKFCNRLCMRHYLNARFDRWIANPQSIALPQNYDEFLSMEDLPCLIDGCGWRGMHLTIHMNTAHGIPAREFKRAAGFNMQSGIIGSSLQEVLSARAKVGVAVQQFQFDEKKQPIYTSYKSLEGAEHSAKARALLLQNSGPERQCIGCGNKFTQSTIFGRAKYCSIDCRRKNSRYRS